MTPGRPSRASISIPLSSARNQPSGGPTSFNPCALSKELPSKVGSVSSTSGIPPIASGPETFTDKPA